MGWKYSLNKLSKDNSVESFEGGKMQLGEGSYSQHAI